jgi:hypothetical protein
MDARHTASKMSDAPLGRRAMTNRRANEDAEVLCEGNDGTVGRPVNDHAVLVAVDGNLAAGLCPARLAVWWVADPQEAHLGYNTALAAGWPITTGVAEGTCPPKGEQRTRRVSVIDGCSGPSRVESKSRLGGRSRGHSTDDQKVDAHSYLIELRVWRR